MKCGRILILLLVSGLITGCGESKNRYELHLVQGHPGGFRLDKWSGQIAFVNAQEIRLLGSTPIPSEASAMINGRLRVDADTVSGTLYNGNSTWRVTAVTVSIALTKKGSKDSMDRILRIPCNLPPHSVGSVSAISGLTAKLLEGFTNFNWSIVSAEGIQDAPGS